VTREYAVRVACNEEVARSSTGRTAPRSAAAPLPRGGYEPTVAGSWPLLQVVADYDRLSAVHAAGRAVDYGRCCPPRRRSLPSIITVM
jgi:hypothetical protein